LSNQTAFLVAALVVNIGAMVYTLVNTRRSALHAETKTRIYWMAALAPVFGLLLYLIKRRDA
jgi:hypothetical protein